MYILALFCHSCTLKRKTLKRNSPLYNTEIQYRMILDMDTVRFIKSFSKGQITIPKDIREAFDIDYLKKLKKIKGDWFSNREFISTRQQVEQKLLKSVT